MAQGRPESYFLGEEAAAFRAANIARIQAELDRERAARGAPQNVVRDQAEMHIARHTCVLEEGTRIEVRAPAGVTAFSIDDLAEVREMLEWYRRDVKGTAARLAMQEQARRAFAESLVNKHRGA